MISQSPAIPGRVTMSDLPVHTVLLFFFSLSSRLGVEAGVWDLELCKTRD